jgi:PAS domain S-box-containing protein
MRQQISNSGISRADAAANAAAAMASIMMDGGGGNGPYGGLSMDPGYASGDGSPSSANDYEQSMDLAMNMGDYYSRTMPAGSSAATTGTARSRAAASAAAAAAVATRGNAEPAARTNKPRPPPAPTGQSKMTVMGTVPASQQQPQQKKAKASAASTDRAADAAAAKAGPEAGGASASGPGPVTISRHINSVINHFTSSKEGYRRLLQELDDLLFVLTPDGLIIYVSPSAKRTLGYAQEELVGKPILDICHADDGPLVTEELEGSVTNATDSAYHARFIKKSGDHVLMEVRGKPYGKEQLRVLGQKDTGRAGSSSATTSLVDDMAELPGGPGEIRFVVNTAREYRSKASLAVDGILELSVENLKLRRQLERALKEKGFDPATHPLLKESENELPPSMLPSELFDSAGLDMREKQGFADFEMPAGGGGHGEASTGTVAEGGEKKKVVLF